jgi:hypothetical protein
MAITIQTRGYFGMPIIVREQVGASYFDAVEAFDGTHTVEAQYGSITRIDGADADRNSIRAAGRTAKIARRISREIADGRRGRIGY